MIHRSLVVNMSLKQKLRWTKCRGKMESENLVRRCKKWILKFLNHFKTKSRAEKARSHSPLFCKITRNLLCFLCWFFQGFLMFSDRLFSICVRQETQNIDFCCFCCTSVLDTFLELLLVDLKYGQILASILCKFIALTLECMCAVNITCVICPLYFTVFFFN
jgi:hypothetical protein